MAAKQTPKSTKTTPEVAQEIGVAESTVRSWLSRYTCFVEGHHYIKEESGRTLWLEAGVEFRKTKSGEFSTVTEIETINPGEEIVEALLSATAQKLAYLYFEKLPQRTVERIQQMLSNPSSEDQEVLQRAMEQSITAGATHLIANSTTRRLQ
jgi:predicted transcriptional regulator